jgi:arginyl-tRNA--protein-N-Asp/Glu arginylyltransferase
MDMSKKSMVQPQHGNTPHECGYCKNPAGSVTMGFSSDYIQLDHYKALMDRGWRKCQAYYYKPDLFESSCPCKWYTIRMDTSIYKLRKSHKKVWKKWVRFLEGDLSLLDEKVAKMQTEKKSKKKESSGQDNGQELASDENLLAEALGKFVKSKESQLEAFLGIASEGPEIQAKICQAAKVSRTKDSQKGSGHYVSNVIQSYFGVFKKWHGLDMKIFCESLTKDIFSEESIAAGFTELPFQVFVNQKNYLCFKNSSQMDTEQMPMPELKPKILVKGKSQSSLAGAKKRKGNSEYKIDINTLPARFRTELVKCQDTDTNWDMYKKYSSQIHGKSEKARTSFAKWLCATNLEYKTPDLQSSNPPTDPKLTLHYGCYHMNWY